MNTALIKETIGLLSSMVNCGEDHSFVSRDMVKRALAELERKDHKRFTRIPTGTIEEGKAQMVFAILYATDGKPYEKYMSIPEEDRGTEIPVVMMQVRWDGKIGFPGGKVDPGEDLLTAIQREVGEETNIYVSKEDFIPFTTFASPASNIHSFLVPLEYDMIKFYHENAVKSKHFRSEVAGIILPHIANYSEERGLKQFLENNFIATAKMELEAFVQEKLKIEV